MFKSGNKKDDFFEIKVDDKQKKHVFSELANKVENYPPKSHYDQDSPRNRKLAINSAFKNLTTRLVYSIAIFTIMFFVLNWQSYSQILKAKVDEWSGEAKTSVLHELIDEELEITDLIEIPKPVAEIAEPAAKKFDITKLTQKKA